MQMWPRRSQRNIKRAAVEQQSIRRHAKSNRRAKDARVLAGIFWLCVLEPDLSRCPVSAPTEAVELYHGCHRHLAIVSRLGQGRVRKLPLKMRNRSLYIQLENADIRPNRQISHQAAKRLAQRRTRDDRISDRSVLM